MPDNFADRLIAAVRSKGSCTVVGIDPRLDLLPKPVVARYPRAVHDLFAAADCFREFGRRIVELAAPLVSAVKPQIAFFERLGPEGLRAYADVVGHARTLGLLVIADVKRNDIATTAQAYAEAYLGPLKPGGPPAGIEVDAVTLNPYLGTDGIQPFVDAARANGKGAFVLVRTSNPSAGEFQDIQEAGVKVFEKVADKVAEWGGGLVGSRGYSSIGAVVGATYPEEAARLRQRMPRAYFLVPGYGAQGGSADDVAPCFNPDGLGAIVNASRSIIFAHRRSPWKEELGEDGWEQAVIAATRQMNEELSRFLPQE
jgi:orotidine-5'-phosphate decarboxylase